MTALPVDGSTRVSARSPAFRNAPESVSRRTWLVSQTKPPASTTRSGASVVGTTCVTFSVCGSIRTRLFGRTRGAAACPPWLTRARMAALTAATSTAAMSRAARRRRRGLRAPHRCETWRPLPVAAYARCFSRGRVEQAAVERIGFRRGVGAQFVGEEPPAPLVHPKGLGAVAGRDVRLHQAPVPRLAKRLERRQLLRPRHRLRGVAGAQTRLGKDGQPSHTDLGQLAALLLHPRSVVAGQQGLLEERRRERAFCLRLVKVARSECVLRAHRRVRRGDDVDPRPLGQLEAIAAERTGQRARAVDPAVREQAAQLARDHRQRLLPGRWRRVLPERFRELVPRNSPPSLGHQVREEQPALPPREARLVDYVTVGFDGDAPREEDPQLRPASHSLVSILPRFRPTFLGSHELAVKTRRSDEEGTLGARGRGRRARRVCGQRSCDAVRGSVDHHAREGAGRRSGGPLGPRQAAWGRLACAPAHARVLRLLRDRQQVRRRRNVGLALAPGAEPDLRGRRPDHQLPGGRPELHAARVHAPGSRSRTRAGPTCTCSATTARCRPRRSRCSSCRRAPTARSTSRIR